MKILQCVGDIDPALGGSVEAARQLSHALDRLGHRPEVVTLQPSRPDWAAEWRGAVHYLGPPSTRYLYSPRFSPWIAARAPQFDAIVIHGLWRYTSVGAWRGLRGRGVPYFVFPHGMLDPYFKRAFRWKHVQKNICWRAAESSVVRDAQGVLFTCEEERRRARFTFRPYACRERIVGLGIARPAGDPAADGRTFLDALPQLAGKRLILFLGRIHPTKGCDLLIQAFARMAGRDPLLRLVMAGPDECGWRGELERLAGRLAVSSRVLFTGPLYSGLKWGALRAAEALALPSHQESFGLTVVEGLACGVPALLSKKVHLWREIQSDGAALAADADATGTISLLDRWLGMPEADRRQMRANALVSFARRFELDRFARDFIACLEKA